MATETVVAQGDTKATADAAAAAEKAAADKTTADAAAAAATAKAGEASADADAKAAAAAAAAEPKAPEKYALTVPDKGALDPADLATIEAIARENNLPNDEAQALVEKQNQLLLEQSARLATELKADKTYGGANLAQTQLLAKSIIDRVRPEGHPRRAAFQRILDKSGYGNHIEIASFLADLGKMAGEDTALGGGSGPGGTKTAEDVLYGKS